MTYFALKITDTYQNDSYLFPDRNGAARCCNKAEVPLALSNISDNAAEFRLSLEHAYSTTHANRQMPDRWLEIAKRHLRRNHKVEIWRP